ncbi:MAG TPA: alpha-amylase family glycosyl hydrolase [Phnomibacter sp.]|nr:alpha-amylase family glycosyl hydrolase [Phnomibacter sp.]
MIVVAFIAMIYGSEAQLLSYSNQFPTESATITVTMDASFGNKGLLGQTPTDVYVHTGVITNLSTSSSNWRYVKFNQNFNQPNAQLQATSLGNNKWSFTITDIRNFYGVPGGEQIQKIAILFRSGNGSKVQRNADGSDMYITVYDASLYVGVTNPYRQPTYIPIIEPINKIVGDNLAMEAKSSLSSNLRLYFNGVEMANQPGVTVVAANTTVSTAGAQKILAIADNGGTPVRDSIEFFVTPPPVVEALPPGMNDGANYAPDNTSVTLVLFAPNKNTAAVLGDFNDWTQTVAHQMKKTPDGQRFWITITGLVPGQEYGYQYLIDGSLKVADYMTQKVLDPWNDQYINQAPYTDRYPNLKPYPTGKTTGIVSVLAPGKPAYNWSAATTGFVRPDKRNLVVYELLVRDFLARNDWKTLIDTIGYLSKTGINTIHLMPFTEFEGNNSWGYNPAFMFAADKFYGPENDLKAFIDTCHGRGIAVVLDLVMNHQFGSSPMVQMYWNSATSKPADNSPWFNVDAKHPFNVGYDMNHEAPATIKFVEDVMRHWLTQYKLDGFRWDLSKGFTQTNNPNDAGAWSNYDQSRVNIWQRIYTQSQAISPNAYMILEHLGVDQEEATLANYGMLLWGKMTDQFNQASMGYVDGSNFDRAYHTTRWTAYGGNNTPHLMAYAESHDEERLMWKNVNYGNAGLNHNVKSLSVSSRRMMAVAAFLYTIPGPKMMWQFGELAYDSSINMCNTLQNNGCRVDPKPLAWAMPAGPNSNPSLPYAGATQNYNANNFRRALKDMTGKIVSLRTKHPEYLPAFVTNNVSFDLSGTFKWQKILNCALNMVVIGNFDVNTVQDPSGNVTFPFAGTWYVYATNVQNTGQGDPFPPINPGLSATTMTVPAGNLTQKFYLPAGTFLLFTDRAVDGPPVTVYNFTGSGNFSDPCNWQGGAIPPAVVPAGHQVNINPTDNNECILNTPLTLQSGALLNVLPGKRFRVNGHLIQQ